MLCDSGFSLVFSFFILNSKVILMLFLGIFLFYFKLNSDFNAYLK